MVQTIMVCHGSQAFDTSAASLVSSLVNMEKTVDQKKLVRESAQRNLLDIDNANHVVDLGNTRANTTRRTLKATAALSNNSANGSWEYNWGGVEDGRIILLHARTEQDNSTATGRCAIWTHVDAPKWEIKLHCPPHPKARSSMISAFSGNGWIMKLGDLKKLGIPINPNWIMDFELPDHDVLYEFVEKAKGAELPDLSRISSIGKIVVEVAVHQVRKRRQIKPRSPRRI